MEKPAVTICQKTLNLPHSHTDIPALPGEAKMGYVMVEAASSGMGEKRLSHETVSHPP